MGTTAPSSGDDEQGMDGQEGDDVPEPVLKGGEPQEQAQPLPRRSNR